MTTQILQFLGITCILLFFIGPASSAEENLSNKFAVVDDYIKSDVRMKNGTAYARSVMKNLTQIIREKWKNIIPRTVHYIVLPLNFSHYEHIVNTGLVFFREADIVYDNEVDSIIRKGEVTCLVARGVIQEIFSRWSTKHKFYEQRDSWFIEGFSTFYGLYTIDQNYHVSSLSWSIVIYTRREFFDYADAFLIYDSQNNPISRSLTFANLWRIKAISVFHMLSIRYVKDVLIPEFIMTEALNIYYNTSSDKYDEQSTPDDMWTKIECNENLKRRISLKRNIRNMITSWTTEIGYPVVQVTRKNNQRVTITVVDCAVNRFTICGSRNIKICGDKWWIPIFYLQVNKDNYVTTYQTVLESNTWIPDITEDDFIIVMHHTGYRVNYDFETWKNIIHFLKNIRPEFVDSMQIISAQILDDAFYFLVQNTRYNKVFNNDTALNIFFEIAHNIIKTAGLSIELYPMLTALEYMSKIFPFPESGDIKIKLQKLLHSSLESTSYRYSSNNSVSNQLYYEVMKWLCILDDSGCTGQVNNIFTWHFENVIKHKLLPAWQKWIYCYGLMLEDEYMSSILWQFITDTFERKEAVKFFTCSKHISFILNCLYDVRNYRPSLCESFIKPTNIDFVTILLDMFAKHAKNVTSLNTIISEMPNIQRYFNVNLPAAVTVMINNIYVENELTKVSGEWLLSQLEYRFNIKKAQFVYKAVMEKIKHRHHFLVEMRNNIRDRPHDVLKFERA